MPLKSLFRKILGKTPFFLQAKTSKRKVRLRLKKHPLFNIIEGPEKPMELKLDLNAKKILDQKFTKDVKGYNPEEVDAFLDRIIQDYLAFSQYQKQSGAYVEGLEDKIAALQNEKQSCLEERDGAVDAKKKLELENASLKNKLGGIKPSDKPTAENIQYISRINQLEDFLYGIGYDPRTLKKLS